MSKVTRLSENTLMDLDFFESHYLTRLRKDISNHKDSDFLKALLKEKEQYTESEWVSFAIRFAANHVND